MSRNVVRMQIKKRKLNSGLYCSIKFCYWDLLSENLAGDSIKKPGLKFIVKCVSTSAIQHMSPTQQINTSGIKHKINQRLKTFNRHSHLNVDSELCRSMVQESHGVTI